jgi:hypothetical protein
MTTIVIQSICGPFAQKPEPEEQDIDGAVYCRKMALAAVVRQVDKMKKKLGSLLAGGTGGGEGDPEADSAARSETPRWRRAPGAEDRNRLPVQGLMNKPLVLQSSAVSTEAQWRAGE